MSSGQGALKTNPFVTNSNLIGFSSNTFVPCIISLPISIFEYPKTSFWIFKEQYLTSNPYVFFCSWISRIVGHSSTILDIHEQKKTYGLDRKSTCLNSS